VIRARCASRLHIQFLEFLRRCPVGKLRPGKALSKLSRGTGPCMESTGNDMTQWLARNMGYGAISPGILKTQQSPRYTSPKLSDP
jgi:hypothetical protein